MKPNKLQRYLILRIRRLSGSKVYQMNFFLNLISILILC